jgi:hypothetical protein
LIARLQFAVAASVENLQRRKGHRTTVGFVRGFVRATIAYAQSKVPESERKKEGAREKKKTPQNV